MNDHMGGLKGITDYLSLPCSPLIHSILILLAANLYIIKRSSNLTTVYDLLYGAIFSEFITLFLFLNEVLYVVLVFCCSVPTPYMDL